MKNKVKVYASLVVFVLSLRITIAQTKQVGDNIVWSEKKSQYYYLDSNRIYTRDLNNGRTSIIFKFDDSNKKIENFQFSNDENKLLVFYNSKRKWRYKSIGSYTVFNTINSSSINIGDEQNQNNIMFAKFSNKADKVAYVFNNNLYVQDINNNKITQITKDSSSKIFNGTYDWSYEEEFKCLDGFRFSANDEFIAFMNINAEDIPYYSLINYTDSIYPQIISFPYPKVSYPIPKAKIGIASLKAEKIDWIKNTNVEQENFIPRIEWFPNENKIIAEYLSRSQTRAYIYVYDNDLHKLDMIYLESDSVWIDVKTAWHKNIMGWEWINNKGDFLWMSEKDGFRKLYTISSTGKETSIIKEGFDIIDIIKIDTVNQDVYFTASPDNPTQRYLYKKSLTNINEPSKKITTKEYIGTNRYNISNNCKYAVHEFSNHYTPPIKTLIELNKHKIIFDTLDIDTYLKKNENSEIKNRLIYTQIKTHNINYDAWVLYPKNFKESKKYPVLFYVYGEPASQVVLDEYASQRNLYNLNENNQNDFIYIAVENRGSPSPRGRSWRKAIYKKNGIINVEDQVTAAKEIMKWNFIDNKRIGVWGWSGGGTMALNLILRYPEIYKVAISIAPVADLKLYNNIYEERYMGSYFENKDNYIKGSPVTYAQRLEGKLLLIHGTGDDNVHFQNFEVMVNEFIKYEKKFQMMVYPNRTHSISEGINTRNHLKKTFTDFIDKELLLKK